MKVLLVDDEVIALRAFRKRVDWVKYGFTEVYEAMDTAEARRILESKRIDLIFCDVEMPGENGLDFIEYVSSNYPSVRSVMLTCHAEFNYARQAIRSGARDYILKPIDYDEMGELLTRIGGEIAEENRRERLDELVNRVKADKEEADDPDSNENRIRLIKDYIDDHIHEKITMKVLADQLHMNEQHMVRIFKKETGQSVLDYITQQRIAVAGMMLRDTDHSINFIADCVGCENYSYFTKIFKKQTGYTPSEYRSQFKKK